MVDFEFWVFTSYYCKWHLWKGNRNKIEEKQKLRWYERNESSDWLFLKMMKKKQKKKIWWRENDDCCWWVYSSAFFGLIIPLSKTIKKKIKRNIFKLNLVLGKMYNFWKFFQLKTLEIYRSFPPLNWIVFFCKIFFFIWMFYLIGSK